MESQDSVFTNKSDDDILNRIVNDEFYKHFLDLESSKKNLNQSLSIAKQIKKLGDGIDLLNEELQKQVLDKYDDLLRQASHATKLESVLSVMNIHVQNLFANAERLKSQITIPFSTLESHTKVLSRLHLASHILRQVSRIQQLNKRLNNTNDPVPKASILQELEQLVSDPDLKDIDIVATELRNVRSQQQKVVKLATGTLTQGIINENLTQTTTALQIFINLGTVKETVNKISDQSINECRDCLRMSLDVNMKGQMSEQAKTKQPGRILMSSSSPNFRNKIWTELEKVFHEDIFQVCKQIKFLQSSLNNLNYNELNAASNFWTKLGETIQDEVEKASPAVQQLLQEEYPKLLKFFYEMQLNLKYDYFKFNQKILEKYENAYLSISLTKLLDPTQALFANTVNEGFTVPSHDQVDALVRIISSELSVGLIEAQLSEKISKNVVKGIKMFSLKTENQLETGPETAEVIGSSLKAAQLKNLQLANTLYYFQVQIQRVLNNMKDSLQSRAEIVSESLDNLTNLFSAIMQPLIVSINSIIETIISTIHQEPDWGKLSTPPTSKSVNCSPYMRELNQFITRAYNTYLAGFENKQILAEKCNEIAIRCIELLVRHASFLRPLSQGGRLRLQADFHQLESTLKQICPQLSDLGRPYRLLKSMASLIVLPYNEIVATQSSGSSVPASTILLMLFCFGGNELSSPHETAGWTPQKFSNWLDEHPNEGDRLDLIAGALQRYETLIRQKNCENYDPVYPVMSTFLENALKNL